MYAGMKVIPSILGDCGGDEDCEGAREYDLGVSEAAGVEMVLNLVGRNGIEEPGGILMRKEGGLGGMDTRTEVILLVGNLHGRKRVGSS